MDLLTPLFEKIGPRLRVKDGAILPLRCAICNRPVTAPPKRFVLRWDPNGTVARQFGAIGALISYFEARRATIYVHFCPWHARRRAIIFISSLIFTISAFIVGNWLSHLWPRDPMPFMICVLGILGCVVCVASAFSNLYFRTVNIEGEWIEIKGFGKRFRESLNPEEMLVVPELSSAHSGESPTQ